MLKRAYFGDCGLTQRTKKALSRYECGKVLEAQWPFKTVILRDCDFMNAVLLFAPPFPQLSYFRPARSSSSLRKIISTPVSTSSVTLTVLSIGQSPVLSRFMMRSVSFP
mgnify:CR=1 FL=1